VGYLPNISKRTLSGDSNLSSNAHSENSRG
jgi:hypothetical protein